MPAKPKPRTQTKGATQPGYARDWSYDIVAAKIHEKTGHTAREFQVKATQAILEGRDVVLHAGTGRGKTLIFAAPHFLRERKISIVISPLILLQHEQRDRMEQMGLKAVAINKESKLVTNVWKDIARGEYQIVFLSPEMALHSEQVNDVFSSTSFQRNLIALHVDEGHTISLWGGDFRKDYRGLGRIRARLPKGVPVSIVSATLRPNVKHDAMATLGFPSDPAEFTDINEGNERANVFISALLMKHPASSFKDLARFIDPNETDPSKIPKTIIYIDDVLDVTLAVIALYSWLHPSLRNRCLIMPVHAWMPPWYRSEAMAKFRSGEVRILVCTEAAGMGCDIPDIKRVVQFGICQSIDALVQRFGRAWRGLGGNGEGWLIFESWVRNEKSKSVGQSKRKCDPLLRGLVTEAECRRKYLNQVYQNPPSDVLVLDQDCCDICDPGFADRLPQRSFETERGLPRAAAVSGEVNPEMLACLETWREDIAAKVFGLDSLYGPEAFISDHDIERVSRCAPIPSMQQLRRYLTKWPDVDDHLESMWNALEDGGFTLPSDPDATSPTFTSSSQTHPPPLQTPGASSSSQGTRNIGSSRSVTATQATSHYAWWRAYMPERNYEVQPNVTQDDFRRIFPSPPPTTRKRKKPPTSTDHDSTRSNKRPEPIPEPIPELGEIHFVSTTVQQPWPTGCDTTIRLGTPIPHRLSHSSLIVPKRPQRPDLPVRYPAAAMYRNLCELRVQTRHAGG